MRVASNQIRVLAREGLHNSFNSKDFDRVADIARSGASFDDAYAIVGRGCDRVYFQKIFYAFYAKERAELNVLAGKSLIEHMASGDLNATIFYLKSKAGYSKPVTYQEIEEKIDKTEKLSENDRAILHRIAPQVFDMVNE